MLIVSCALIYDDAIRACAVSTVTADRKFVLLTYSLTASHCSAEAHLAGVPFPRSIDSRLALRQTIIRDCYVTATSCVSWEATVRV